MYIHAFVFRWVKGTTEEQKRRVKTEILALQGKIPGLLETHVGANVSPRGQEHEFGGVMKFTDRAALEAYFPHPVHQALGEWLMPLIEPLELDFEAASSTEEYKTE
jgi:antibiotic biosynthesis monooxygenase (ABM) superfamily enzyme